MIRQSTKIKRRTRTVKITYSFKQWCEDNNKQTLLERWDYSLNDKSPDEVSFKSNKKFYFKCPRGLHESVYKSIQYLPAGRQQDLLCDKCKSFAQYIIDNRSEEILNYIWSEKNEKSPWEYASQANKKVWLVCEKDSSHVYQMSLDNYIHGNGCPYCAGRKLDSKNNLAALYPEVLEVWSEKNEKNPDQYKFHAIDEVWWKCEYGIHEDFLRTITRSTTAKFRCPICAQIYPDSHFKVYSGMQAGSLTVISPVKNNNINLKFKKSLWLCSCICGNEVVMSDIDLILYKNPHCGGSKHNGIDYKKEIRETIVLTENAIARRDPRYKIWRKEVSEKDGHVCQCCGEYKHIKENIHHILSFGFHEDTRFDVSNGITLCDACHDPAIPNSLHDIYGSYHDVTPDQLESYINHKRRELNIPLPFSLLEYEQRINILKPNTVEELIQTTNNNQNNK